MTSILSIQSHVSYGHVGNSAAVFPMQRLGVEVWPVLTVTFSNHTGYGDWRGPLIGAADVRDVVLGIDDRGALGQVDAVLSGYQGSEGMGLTILDSVRLVKQRNPRAIYCCDPVMGDVETGFYALPGIPEFIRDHCVPEADIMTPNLFELEFLTGRRTEHLRDVVAAAEALRRRGPRIVVVTSAVEHATRDDVMHMLAVSDQGVFQVETPLLHQTFTGSGDLTAAMFLVSILEHGDVARALSETASRVYSVLESTASRGQDELALVAAQDDLVAPRFEFTATPVPASALS